MKKRELRTLEDEIDTLLSKFSIPAPIYSDPGFGDFESGSNNRSFSKQSKSTELSSEDYSSLKEPQEMYNPEKRLMGCLQNIETELDEIDKLMAECGLDLN